MTKFSGGGTISQKKGSLITVKFGPKEFEGACYPSVTVVWHGMVHTPLRASFLEVTGEYSLPEDLS